ncbi:MAG TPA: hypothetical protein VNZ64_24175 [Candidatus Acidoferrum sp.]|jgi:hypothetical protein|nr:hypothetical protein [Candidatus Acidoferrum sp.]
MMLILVRLPLTLLYIYLVYKATVSDAAYSGSQMIGLVLFILLGAIVMGALWAPVIGAKLSDPLTSAITQETSLPPDPNRLVGRIRWLQGRGHHRLALLLVFAEGMRHPDLPQAAILGLRSVRPGSLLEKWFAKEVYHFNNVQNCLQAYTILKERHGIILPLHRQPEVNLAIVSLDRKPPPEPAKLQLTPAEAPAQPARNPQIKLFEK